MSKFPIFYLPRLTIIGVSSNLSQNILKLLRFFSGSEEAVRACSQPGRDVMQVRGPGPRGQQNIGACASWSPGDPCDIRPPTPAHRALAWGHQAWSPSSWPDMEIIIRLCFPRLPTLSSSSLSLLAAPGHHPAAARAPSAAAAETTINIRTYSVADSFTSDLLGLLGPIEDR